jgi:hypothetical protein
VRWAGRSIMHFANMLGYWRHGAPAISATFISEHLALRRPSNLSNGAQSVT